MADADTLFRLDRKIPLGLIGAFVLQTGAGLWWAGSAAQRITDLEQRIDHQAGVAERLARLETQADATRLSLARIEAKLDGPASYGERR
jgi:hypothetical protein